jgi:hypothetical protein
MDAPSDAQIDELLDEAAKALARATEMPGCYSDFRDKYRAWAKKVLEG